MPRLAAFLVIAACAFAEETHPSVLETSEVTFAIDAPTASKVSVVGDFNGWDATRTPLAKDPTGTWRVRTDLRKGKVYDYAFVVDGHWIVDPRNPIRSSGGKLSVIEVPGGPEDAIAGGGLEPIRAMMKRISEKLSFYGDEIAALRRELAGHAETIAKKEAQIELLREDLDDARNERVTLMRDLTEARIRLDEVSQRYATLKAEKENRMEESDKAVKRAADLQKQCAELQAKMNSLLQEKRVAEERAQKAEQEAREAQARFKALDERYNMKDREERPISCVAPGDPARESPVFGPEPSLDAPELSSKPTEGRVLAVGTSTRYLMISLGAKHGVKAGDEFLVRRGVQTIARVRVEKVHDEYSSAEVQGDVKMTEIAVDDPVIAGTGEE